jgi:hypothetical protein
MRILPEYAGVSTECAGPCMEEDEAVMGLQASLRSSDSLKGILECAKGRCVKRNLDSEKLKRIERICKRYESHQKDVRDHCLDYFNSAPTMRVAPALSGRTGELIRKGRELYSELRETILSTY